MTELDQQIDVVSDNGFPTADGPADRARLADSVLVEKYGKRLPYEPVNRLKPNSPIREYPRTSVLPVQVIAMPNSERDSVLKLYAKSPFSHPDGSRSEQWTDSISIDPKGPLLSVIPKTWEEIQADLERMRIACSRAGLRLVPDDYFSFIREDPSRFYDGPSAVLGKISYVVGVDGWAC